MGGTTAKFVRDRRRRAADRARVRGRPRATASRRARACRSRSPVIEMIEIGAGGGSIARVDALGLLQGRAGLARAPIPGRSATGAAAPSRPSPTPTWCSATSTRPSSSAAGWRSTSTGARRGDRSSTSPQPLGLTRRAGGLGHPPDRQREHGQRRARPRAGARQRPARPAGVRVRRRRARCTAIGSRAALRRAGADRAVRRRRDEHGRLPGRAAGVRLRALVRRRSWTTLDWDRVNALLAEMEAEGRALLGSLRASPPTQITHTPRGRHALRRPGPRDPRPLPAGGSARTLGRAARGVRARVRRLYRPARPDGAAGGDQLARASRRARARAEAAPARADAARPAQAR